jgi:Ca2+-binding EF-hand superfamily protein
MSRRKVLIVAAILVAGGAAIAVSAPGYRGHGMGGGGMDRWLDGDGRHGFGTGYFTGRWGRELTRQAFDEKVRERFARFDLNSDGAVDVAEIEAALAKAGKRHRGFRGFRERRAEREGATKEEAAPGRSMTKPAYLDEVRRRFALLDLDSDGRITEADLPPTMRNRDALARLSSEQAPATRRHRHAPRLGFLRGATVDKDGGIPLDEVLRVAGERFDRMDRNKDGTLDRADRQAFAKEMTDYRVKRILHRFGAVSEGRITREQAFKVAGEMFDRLDRNKDGTISRSERPRRWHRDRRNHDERYRRGRGEERAPDGEQKKI